MARGPNSRPDKGFSKELTKASKLHATPVHKPFNWKKPVTGVAESDDQGTTRRLQRQNQVPGSDTDMATEMADYLEKRRSK